MNYAYFWQTVTKPFISFEERLELVKTSGYNLFEECQPWCILQYFADIEKSDTPVEDAFKVAKVFKDRMGLLIVERESSHYSRKFMTIMDEFENHSSCNYNDAGCSVDHDCSSNELPLWVSLLRDAFRDAGFLFAKDVDPRVMYAMYLDAYYYEFEDTPFVEPIPPSPLTEELIQYLLHPDRLGKWMEANPDKEIEDYLK